MRFKESLKEYFSFTRNDRLGAIWLITACVVLLVVLIIQDTWIVNERENVEIELIERVEEPLSDSPDTLVLFEFDPNGLPQEEWIRLGLTKEQVKGIHNYEKAGGVFRTKEDVRKMYTISEEKYLELEPFISIKGKVQQRTSQEPKESGSVEIYEKTKNDESSAAIPAPGIVRVELNSADSADLVQVKGIGPVFARSIIKYRGLIGGYHSLDQLNEVYVLQDKPDAVKAISAQLELDTDLIRKININSADPKELATHIYIDWKVANAVVAYRNNHGNYQKVEDLTKCVLVDAELLTKIAPYLTVD